VLDSPTFLNPYILTLNSDPIRVTLYSLAQTIWAAVKRQKLVFLKKKAKASQILSGWCWRLAMDLEGMELRETGVLERIWQCAVQRIWLSSSFPVHFDLRLLPRESCDTQQLCRNWNFCRPASIGSGAARRGGENWVCACTQALRRVLWSAGVPIRVLSAGRRFARVVFHHYTTGQTNLITLFAVSGCSVSSSYANSVVNFTRSKDFIYCYNFCFFKLKASSALLCFQGLFADLSPFFQ
jgi:hypothetical protein